MAQSVRDIGGRWMAHIAEALLEINQYAESTVAKGKGFERLIKAALQQHPGEFGPQRFEEVWLWDEWPERDGPDKGIDLVGKQTERYGGGLCAIQCKFYDPNSVVPKGEVDKFLAASGTQQFTDRLFIATTEVAKQGEVLMEKAHPHCALLTVTAMDDWVDDWRRYVDRPEDLVLRTDKHEPRPDQEEALREIEGGLATHTRGKLILPCGTGKSVIALWAAERLVGLGGRVVCFVPSLALMGQTMREWARHGDLLHRYVAVCSDATVGKRQDVPGGAYLHEISIPPSTKLTEVRQALSQFQFDQDMQVVFCTYQSAPVLANALEGTNIRFDLMICDEAHRTTGIQSQNNTSKESETSGFHIVHDDERIPARKRLYMTATPRVFTEAVKRRVDRLSDQAGYDIDSFSMDDKEVYGEVLHQMTFADAIDERLLTDYELLVIGVSDRSISDELQQEAQIDKFDFDDVVKLMGCWDALADPTTIGVDLERTRSAGQLDAKVAHARTAISFANTVKASKNLTEWWDRVVKDQIPSGDEPDKYLQLDVQHIDGTTPAIKRAAQIANLRDTSRAQFDGNCRILSNARVLTEGVDVPALDAIIFFQNRKSKIDITQAVGRVMRRAAAKAVGYVIVPVVVPEGSRMSDAEVLDGSDFKIVWDVIRALRSHDERVDYWVNNVNALKKNAPIRILDRTNASTDDEDSVDVETEQAVQLRLRLDDKIASKIVEMNGDRQFWPRWGVRAAGVCQQIHDGLRRAADKKPAVADSLSNFAEAMRRGIGPQVTDEAALEMIAQHVVTIPVFDHIFSESQFASVNPVSKEIERVLETLRNEDISFDHELSPLNRAYATMQRAFDGAQNPAEKVDILRQIYEGFFESAMKDTVKRLGIVYTPVELVDFILRSADAVCREEFGYGLTHKNVHILDPFAGTGTFLYRLLTLQDADGNFLIRDQDLLRKYQSDMHANEIVLLAYYIAALKIEAGMAERGGFADDQYEEFPGVVLQDTMLPTTQTSPRRLPGLGSVQDNSERAARQDELPIQVIATNPPWSTGQDDAGEDNPNLRYEHIAERVRETYGAAQVSVTGRSGGGNSAGNLYIQALRWMSDRLGAEQPGVIAFVHPNSLANAVSLAGARKVLRDEFTKVYCINLRGNAYTMGDEFRREGEKVFGGNSRNGGQITVLVRNPKRSTSEAGSVYYAEVPDAQRLPQKFAWLADIGVVNNSKEVSAVPINDQHDWVNLSDGTFGDLLPVWGDSTKQDSAVIRSHASGVKTNCDEYVYAFSRPELVAKVERLIAAYSSALQTLANSTVPQENAIEALTQNKHLTEIKWTETLESSLRNGEIIEFSEDRIREVLYRPFTKVWLYEDFRILSRGKAVSPMFPRAIHYTRERSGAERGEARRGDRRHQSQQPHAVRHPSHHSTSGSLRRRDQPAKSSDPQMAIMIRSTSDQVPFGLIVGTVLPDLCVTGRQTRAIPRSKPSS